jgi:hypothetical protein
MLKTFVNSARALAAATSLACVAMVGSVGFAGAGTGTLPGDGNTAVTFDPSTPTPVVVRFSDPKISDGVNFQLGFSTNSTNLFEIGNIEYSFDTTDGVDGTWTEYINPFGFVGADPTTNWDGITAYSTLSDDIYFRYELPGGEIDYSSITQVSFLSNNDGATTDGILSGGLGNGLVELNRDHIAIDAPVVPEPTTFAIASIGLGMAGVARLRKRLAAKKA